MLLAEIHANSIHSLRELSHALESWIVHLTYGPPQLRRSAVVIDTLHYSCVYSWDGPYVVLSTRTTCEFDNVKV